jgi:cis-3-alkyl-4-acyloxetan-2-one decarboxylase
MVNAVTDISAFRDLYPFDSHFISFNYGKLAYHYLDEGPRTKGKAVVMLHGNPTWSFYYRNVVLALRDKYRCIVPDHMGCGLSDKPQDYPYTLAQHVTNVESLLDRLEISEASLIVHDWGGAIGMGVAVRNPARIKKLVVLNTAAFSSSRIPKTLELARLPIFGDIAIRGLNCFAKGALQMAVAHKDRITPEVRAGYLAPYDSWENRIATLRFVQDIPMLPSHPTWPVLKSIEAGLDQFKNTPMQLHWGMKDFVFNESFLKTWQEKFPAAEATRYEDAAHYVLEDAHERITPKIREFLDRA